MLIRLYLRRSCDVPVDAACINPDIFSEKSAKELAKLRVFEGNRKRTLNALFKIQPEDSDKSEKVSIRISGNIGKMRRIGAEMSKGEIIIEGNVGMHLGEEMKGGFIRVSGNADSWVGSMMKNGFIQIAGNAGDYVGAAYRGSTRGMAGGEIQIHGTAGSEVGCFMRNGLIKVYGNIGQFAGIHMRKGTIFIQGDSAGRAGAQMVNGKIVICGHVPSVLPTFSIDGIRSKVKVNKKEILGPFYRFVGDLADRGKGRLFVSHKKNPHLHSYTQYL